MAKKSSLLAANTTDVSVALVRVLGKDKYESNTADHNVGLIYLADSATHSGARCTIFDPYDREIYVEDEDPLFMGKFSIFAFTTHYLNIEETLDLCKTLKARFPNSLLLLGGHQVASAAKELLDDCPFIDIVSVGEGEHTLANIVLRLKSGESLRRLKAQGIFYPEKYIDLMKSSIPNRSSHYSIARMLTSRGCPYSCTFCTTPAVRDLTREPVYRERSPKQVVDEMEDLIYKCKTHRIYLNDDLFVINSTQSHQRALQIANEIIRRNLKISYKAQLRADSFKIEHISILKNLRASGLREVFMGIESGSDITLSRYNKKISLQENISAIQLYDSVGIKVNAGNIVASPDSSMFEICESINSFSQIQLAYLFFRRVSFRAIAFPGTALEKQLDLQGRLEARPKYFVRNYSFLDSRVGDVVYLLENRMPTFLGEVGGKIFKMRNRCVIQYHELKVLENRENNQLLQVLSDWNHISAKFLLRWFRDIPVAQLEEYQEKVYTIGKILEAITNQAKIEEFDNDSF
jgi:anaerobic magnesium-protoporphyrin IX monomethyl ester cyclase